MLLESVRDRLGGRQARSFQLMGEDPVPPRPDSASREPAAAPAPRTGGSVVAALGRAIRKLVT